MTPDSMLRRLSFNQTAIVCAPILYWLITSPIVLFYALIFASASSFADAFKHTFNISVLLMHYIVFSPAYLAPSVILALATTRRIHIVPLRTALIISLIPVFAFQLYWVVVGDYLSHPLTPIAAIIHSLISAALTTFLTIPALLILSRRYAHRPPFRSKRIRRCPACSYDLRNLPPSLPCPECGARRRPRPSPKPTA